MIEKLKGTQRYTDHFITFNWFLYPLHTELKCQFWFDHTPELCPFLPPWRHRNSVRDAEELKKTKDDLAKMTETKGDSKREAGDQPDSNAHMPESKKVKTAVDAVPGIKTILSSA